MPDYTENLNLAKPVPGTDVADITVLNENMDKLDEWSKDINAKTGAASAVIPGIVKYGTDASTALEGAKLAEILGVTYGGILNNSNAKTAGIAYYCTTNKKIYKCTANTSLNYADASYFMELSNNDLLGKLQNLIKVRNEIKTSISFRNSLVVYSSATLAEFKESDMIYLICDSNDGGEGYAHIAPVSLFRNGPPGTRVTLEVYDSSVPNTKISLGVETSTGNLTLSCNVSNVMYLRYLCVISSII